MFHVHVCAWLPPGTHRACFPQVKEKEIAEKDAEIAQLQQALKRAQGVNSASASSRVVSAAQTPLEAHRLAAGEPQAATPERNQASPPAAASPPDVGSRRDAGLYGLGKPDPIQMSQLRRDAIYRTADAEKMARQELRMQSRSSPNSIHTGLMEDDTSSDEEYPDNYGSGAQRDQARPSQEVAKVSSEHVSRPPRDPAHATEETSHSKVGPLPTFP